MFKRNLKYLALEILMPIILVIIGFGFSYAINFPSSPLRALSITDYPLKQRILMNSNTLYTSNLTATNGTISP